MKSTHTIVAAAIAAAIFIAELNVYLSLPAHSIQPEYFDTPCFPAESRTIESEDHKVGDEALSFPQRPRILFVTYAYVSFSDANKDRDRFTTYIFKILDTWLTNDTLHVVLNRNNERAYQNMCNHSKETSRYCKRIRPIYVDCPEGRGYMMFCCKQEKGLATAFEIIDVVDYDWILYFDDDMYLRMSYLEDFLRPLDSSQELVLTSHRGPKSEKHGSKLGKSSFDRRPQPYNCSDDTDFKYPWGQPLIYSRAAFKKVYPGLRAGGMSQICSKFEVAQDIGDAIFNWVYQLPEVRLNIPTTLSRIYGFSYEQHGLHSVGKMSPTFDVTHKEYSKLGQPSLSKSSYQWHTAFGFRRTNLYKKHGDPWTWNDTWYNLSWGDCWPSDQ